MAKPIVVATTLYWAQTNQVNDLSGKYQVNLGQLSEKAVEALTANGIDVKNKGDEQGYFITVKSANPIKVLKTIRVLKTIMALKHRRKFQPTPLKIFRNRRSLRRVPFLLFRT